MRRNRRKPDADDKCIENFLLPLMILLLPFYALVKIIIAVGPLLLVVLAVGLVILIISLLYDQYKRRMIQKANYLTIANSQEPKPTLCTIPSGNSVKGREEKAINGQYVKFLQQYNEVIKIQCHVDYLERKKEAICLLGKIEGVNELSEEIYKSKQKLESAKKARVSFGDSNKSIPPVFYDIIYYIGNVRISILDDFLAGIEKASIKIADSEFMVFLPHDILKYSEKDHIIRVLPLRNFRVHESYTTELLEGELHKDDEVAYFGYLHETKDGRRDMRYKSENNPSYTTIYRGLVTICYENIEYSVRFKNKKEASLFKKEFEECYGDINRVQKENAE